MFIRVIIAFMLFMPSLASANPMPLGLELGKATIM